jgi:TonB-dependent receptor
MSLVALALAQAFASQAMAQQAPADANTVIVRGIRASAESALSIKKNSMEVVDAITADDIGKLPDPNVAETLTRLPGVQGYRYGGEGASPNGTGSGMSIRGLAGQTSSQYNGRAYFTAGSREFNIEDAIPSMIAGVEVYKNPSAEHIEGGIGGLINVRTRSPLDFKEFTASLNANMRYNDLAQKKDPELFGLVANRFDLGGGRRLGLLAAFAYQKTTNRSDSSGGSGSPEYRRYFRADSAEYATKAAANTNNNPALPLQQYVGRNDISYVTSVPTKTPSATVGVQTPDTSGLTPEQAANVASFMANGPWPGQETIMRTRKGLNLGAEYRHSNTLRLYAEGNYTYYLYNQNYRFIRQLSNYFGNVQNLTFTPFAMTESLANHNFNGGPDEVLTSQRVLSGTFLGQNNIQTWGGDEHSPYTTWTVATGAEWNPTPALSLKADISYIKADRIKDNRRVEFATAPGASWNIARVNQNWDDGHLTQFSGSDLSDPKNFVFSKYSGDAYWAYDDNAAATALSGVYTFDEGFFSRLKFGTRLAHQVGRFYNKTPYQGDKWLTTDGKPLAADFSNAISVASKPGVIEGAPSNFMNNERGYPNGYVVYSPSALLGNQVATQFPQAGILLEGNFPENQLNRRYLNEHTTAGYVSADFAAFDERLKGNVGVRVVRTKSEATARVLSNPSVSTSPLVDSTKTTTYTNVLPSLNVTYDLAKDLILRAGYGRGITRPDLDKLNPNISPNFGTGGVSQGNPELRPQIADSYDIGIERYFSPTNYVALGVFDKEIDGFFSTLASCAVAPTLGNPVANNGCPAGQWLVSKNVNAAKGYARGVELSGQWFFNAQDNWLKNFGVAAAYTYVDTDAPLNIGTATAPKFISTWQNFTSKNQYSVTGMYEDNKLSARLVYTWRSSQSRGYNTLTPISSTYLPSYALLDASISYAIDSHLTLALNASNLTNAAPQRYAGEPGTFETNREGSHFVNGRNFSLGLRYKF